MQISPPTHPNVDAKNGFSDSKDWEGAIVIELQILRAKMRLIFELRGLLSMVHYKTNTEYIIKGLPTVY